MINMVVVSMYGVHQKRASRREGDKPSGNYRRVPWGILAGLDLFLQPVTLVRAPTFAMLARAALALPR